jgi:hypothetical protein
LILGGIAAIVSKTVVAPFDRIKIIFLVNLMTNNKQKTRQREFRYKEAFKDAMFIF